MRAAPKNGFTVIELLIVIGIITVLLGILLPTVERVRHRAYIETCAANLHSIGQAMTMYANENHGNYPRATYDPALAASAGWTAGNDFAMTQPTEITHANDITAAVWLLMRTQKLPSSIFVCAYGDVNEFEADKADPLLHANFTNYRKNLSYSFADMYPDAQAMEKGYKWTNKLGSDFAVAADINPGIKPPGYDVTAPQPGARSSEMEKGNSGNHEQEGQNVLFGDGHVIYAATPLCGVAGDNIYINRNRRLDQSPVDKDDSLLVPTD